MSAKIGRPIYHGKKRKKRKEKEKIHKKNQTLFMDEIIIDQHFNRRKKGMREFFWADDRARYLSGSKSDVLK